MSTWRCYLLAVFLLSGCSSSGTSNIFSMVVEDVLDTAAEAEAGIPADTITREQIEKLGVALIRVHETRPSSANLLVALRKSEMQVTYVLRSERRMILHGGLIQSTEGFGDNLEPISVNAADPVAFPRPLARWPQIIERNYTVSERGPGETSKVTCRFEKGQTDNIDIVGKTVLVQEVTETCTGDGQAFVNRHDVDTKTGLIWRSAQWTGDNQGVLVYEVLEPLD